MLDLKCQRPNCTGSIEDDYCNVCGMAAAKAVSFPIAPKTNTSRTAPSAITKRSQASRRSSSVSSRAQQLGSGLVSIPELPSTDPEKLVIKNPMVPENKRFCSKCNHTLRREQGFCSKCGQKFSFVVGLQPGELVAGQYAVRGAIAFGGLGWIYLGFDQVLSRYVVLKGLLNSEDQASAAVAVAEKQFLAAVKHPNIVGIYNFVNHADTGLIVMEYVGGQTLKELRKSRGVLPVTEAIAYIHRILGAFSYLHNQGLVYCDFKPDNIMLEGNDVKLIDMGGVRRIDDLDGDIYGTVGYSAPEAGAGPTLVTDLFTIGRTLAILIATIPDFGTTNQYQLPSDLPIFIQHESLYRWLLKATATDPTDRFQTAAEMADQLLLVLHEAVAIETNKPQPLKSQLFSGDRLTNKDHILEPVVADYHQLPVPFMSPTDPAFSEILNAPSEIHQQHKAYQTLVAKYPQSIEALLKLASCETDLGFVAFKEIDLHLQAAEKLDPWDWRVLWYRGRAALAHQQYLLAIDCFNQIYADLPGEIAPKIALAMAAELHKDQAAALRLYDRVCRIDPNYSTAVFGLARCLQVSHQRPAAVQALSLVSHNSSLYHKAQVQATNFMIQADHQPPGLAELFQASENLNNLSIGEMERYQLSIKILNTALEFSKTNQAKLPSDHPIPSWLYEERQIRQKLEQVLKSMARLSSGSDRIALVDKANQIRPRTWL
jgi:serine/threonine-protein kinase PknG